MEKMNQYSSSTKIKQIMYYLIAYRCNVKEDLIKYINMFKKLDTDKNGYIKKD